MWLRTRAPCQIRLAVRNRRLRIFQRMCLSSRRPHVWVISPLVRRALIITSIRARSARKTSLLGPHSRSAFISLASFATIGWGDRANEAKVAAFCAEGVGWRNLLNGSVKGIVRVVLFL